ncbi:hypothetical protein Poli38472_006762 [Pythium oligandrum]|uniref:Uncharacterized protein n=1 Tax=Pythium oligandrum TaxID=41045 RepID=A0A8K1C584_PYTOL|nr:hypothetical protein Poli38472_006762 [Pythium oligandrum]|eukprot:TMW56752.1 hypothetical protein Poli38472_006762 [Pythium oligandrum]
MSSALASFARGQQEEVVVDVEEEYAKSEDETTTRPTLMDVAREQAATKATTLMEVAQAEQTKTKSKARTQLAALAAQMDQEEEVASQQRAAKIQQAIELTSVQVQKERQNARAADVRQALQEAVKEAEQAYQDDEFETPEDAMAIQRAAELLTQKANSAAAKPALSADRHVLKQQRRLPPSKSTTKAKTMKEQLSQFQFEQLSTTQRRLFLAMLVDDEAKSTPKKRCNMHVINQLAMDKASKERQQRVLEKTRRPVYAKLDDARHCRFKPRLKGTNQSSSRANDSDDDGDNQRTEDFIRRMEATERVRTETIRRTRAEREYNALVDKKECPQCGNPQSYAELTQKRKKCPNCGVTYRSRLAWCEIADEFLERMAAHLRTRLEWQQRQKEDAEGGAKSNNQKQPAPKTWQHVQDEFLGRVQLDMMQRELSKDLILQELTQECTFQPVISDRAKRLQLGDFDERLRRDLENRRIRQEQYRVLTRAIAKAEAHQRRGDNKPLRGGFQKRLRADLEKRRERLNVHSNQRETSRMAWSTGHKRA